MNILEIDDLHVSFSLYGQELQAVRGISFSVKEGEAIGIVGESGCGKSAAIQAIARLSPNAKIRGKILFEGEDLLQKKEKEMQKIRGKKIGMVFQDPMTSLNPTMKIGAQIEESLKHHKIEVGNRPLELLKQVEMPDPEIRISQYPHELSGGMRQRALIAIALACEPKLLIADEPTTAPDVTIQAQILDLFQKRSPKTSLILVTHDLAIVSAICERIFVCYAGKIVEAGPVHQILNSPRHPYTQLLLRALPRLDLPKSLKPLQTIEGNPPNPLALIQGCAFAPRCPYADPLCSRDPPWIGSAACWRADP